MEDQLTMKHVWEAFSTLSDAQELISMGRNESANDMINHAKQHLSKVFEQDQTLLQEAMLNMSVTCEV
mgnify:FL=1|tara:strand:+ start:206 stop:409 length:204 start_codon:yes stop_codon:yes gene_type:complete